MRYIRNLLLGSLVLATTCHTSQKIPEPPAQVVEQEKPYYFSDILFGQGDRFLSTLRSRLLNYQSDEEFGVRETDQLGRSYFPVLGQGKLRKISIGNDTIRIENSGRIKQDVPGYENQLVIKSSQSLEFRYKVIGTYLALRRVKGKIWTEFAKGIPRPLGLAAIAAVSGNFDIDPEIDIDTIVFGEFEGRPSGIMIYNKKTRRYCLMDLEKMDFIETQKSYEDLIAQIKTSDD